MQSNERAERCLNWIEKATWPDEGVAAWIDLPLVKKGPPYPEVTGYLIPTLLHWGKDWLAEQYANWLVKVQDPEGYWLGIDKRPRTFDTAMCANGLRCIPGSRKIEKAIRRADEWLILQGLREDGAIRMGPGTEYSPFYTVLVSAYMNAEPYYWHFKLRDEDWPWADPERMHYILYGLAGMLHLGYDVQKW